MEQLSDNIIFWIEDFDGIRKLNYGILDPDKESLDDGNIFLHKQMEYLNHGLDFSMLNKFHLQERNVCSGIKDTKVDNHALFSCKYRQDKVKPYIIRYKDSESHIWIKQIMSNQLQDIAVSKGVLILIPKVLNPLQVAQFIAKTCEKYKYESVNTDDFNPMFAEIVTKFSGSSVVTDLGICFDARNYKEKPNWVELVCSQNIYGELAKT